MAGRDQRVDLIDLGRVLGILLILYSHISITLQFPYNRAFFIWRTWGELGVTAFLVVSGMTLQMVYGARPPRLGGFFLKRLIRIFPVYYISLAIGLSLLVLRGVKESYLEGRAMEVLPEFGWDDLVLTLTGMNAVAGHWGGKIVPASWFISLLLPLYLLFPFLSRLVSRRPLAMTAATFLISVLSYALVDRVDILRGHPHEWFPLCRLFEFAMGMIIVRLAGGERIRSLNARLGRIPGLTFLGRLSFPLFLIHDPFRKLLYFTPVIALGTFPAILIFLGASVTASSVVLWLDDRIQGRLRQWARKKGKGMP